MDDDETLLMATKRLLAASEPAWEVITASGGDEALELLRDQAIAVVITDWCMPHTDGAELLKLVAQHHPATMRIVHTSRPATHPELAHVPAHRFVQKPAAPAHFLAIARWAVRQAIMLARASSNPPDHTAT